MTKSRPLSDHKALYYPVLPVILLFIRLSNGGSYLYNVPVADPGEAPPPHIFRPKRRTEGQKHFGVEITPPSPLLSQGLEPALLSAVVRPVSDKERDNSVAPTYRVFHQFVWIFFFA